MPLGTPNQSQAGLDIKYAQKIRAAFCRGDSGYYDKEYIHVNVDELMVELLVEAGYPAAAAARKEVEDRCGFWYA